MSEKDYEIAKKNYHLITNPKDRIAVAEAMEEYERNKENEQQLFTKRLPDTDKAVYEISTRR